jgi:hypothetical protein
MRAWTKGGLTRAVCAGEVRRAEGCVRGLRAHGGRGRSRGVVGTFKFVHEGKRIGPNDTPEEVRRRPAVFRTAAHAYTPSPPFS